MVVEEIWKSGKVTRGASKVLLGMLLGVPVVLNLLLRVEEVFMWYI